MNAKDYCDNITTYGGCNEFVIDTFWIIVAVGIMLFLFIAGLPTRGE